MRKVIVLGSEDVDNLYYMLDKINQILDKQWAFSYDTMGAIHIIDTNTSDIDEQYLVINADVPSHPDLSIYHGSIVITVGFNTKASITISSVANGRIVFCVQRDIIMATREIEPQEFVMESDFFESDDILNIIFTFTAMILLEKKDVKNLLLNMVFKE